MIYDMEINPNALRELRMKEGLKNPDDVFELSNRKGEETESSSAEGAQERLQEIINTFVEDTTRAVEEAFQLLLEEYRKRKNLPSVEIIRYLEEHELHKPQFSVAGKDRKEFLANLGFSDNTVKVEQIPVSFQLPKPIAQFWYKGGTDSWGSLGEEVGPHITEWGHFYRALMKVVWEKIGYYESEKGLVFERVNGIGDHDPKSYYYVWKISRWAK